MKPKTVKICYWIFTILFAAFMLMSGIMYLMQDATAKQAMVHLGYPVYFLLMLGVAKILGALTLLYPPTKLRTLKEWAYAGFTFNILAACIAIYAAGDGIVMALFPLIFLVVMFLSYGFWKVYLKVA